MNKRSTRPFGALLAAGLVAAGCSHAAAGQYPPSISTARLADVPPAQLSGVQSEQATLDEAKSSFAQANRDVHDVKSRLNLAKSELQVAKSELKAQKARAEASTAPVQPGAEQRAAEPAAPEVAPEAVPAPGSAPAARPGAYPPVSDLFAAQLKQDAAKLRVDYLETLVNYADARRDVADRLVGYDQARVDQSVFGALRETRPEEAQSMKHQAGWYASEVAKRQSDLADARAKMDDARGKALRRFDAWQSAFARLRPADRTSPAPAPDTLPPL